MRCLRRSAVRILSEAIGLRPLNVVRLLNSQSDITNRSLTAALSTVAGQTIIPIPVIGAMAGSMVGYLLGTSLYRETKEILEYPNWSQEQRDELKVKYSEAVELMNGYKKELSTLCKKDRFCSQIITEFLNQVE